MAERVGFYFFGRESLALRSGRESGSRFLFAEYGLLAESLARKFWWWRGRVDVTRVRIIRYGVTYTTTGTIVSWR